MSVDPCLLCRCGSAVDLWGPGPRPETWHGWTDGQTSLLRVRVRVCVRVRVSRPPVQGSLRCPPCCTTTSWPPVLAAPGGPNIECKGAAPVGLLPGLPCPSLPPHREHRGRAGLWCPPSAPAEPAGKALCCASPLSSTLRLSVSLTQPPPPGLPTAHPVPWRLKLRVPEGGSLCLLPERFIPEMSVHLYK